MGDMVPKHMNRDGAKLVRDEADRKKENRQTAAISAVASIDRLLARRSGSGAAQ